MRKVIDFHSHLGDIFHENKNYTFKQNVSFGDYPNPFAKQAASGFVDPLLSDVAEIPTLIDAGQYLCWENTLQSYSAKLDAEDITYICAYPILPNISFEEYLAASKLEPRILPFTSADYTLPIPEMVEKLEKDIENGAKGLKIHPILQNIYLSDSRVKAAVEVFGEKGIPIVSHCGVNDYYAPEKPYARNPEAGDLKYFVELAETYPDYILVAAHGGGLNGGELDQLHEMVKASNLTNVYVDTTFRSAADVRKMVEYFGEDKVLYGTDTPFSNQAPSINEVVKAFPNNPEITEKILYGNAARILKV